MSCRHRIATRGALIPDKDFDSRCFAFRYGMRKFKYVGIYTTLQIDEINDEINVNYRSFGILESVEAEYVDQLFFL